MTNQITVYSYDPITFEYVGETIARRDPLEQSEMFLIPANATDKQPIFQEGKISKFINNEWTLENIPLPPEPEQPTLQETKTSKLSQLESARKEFQYKNIELNGETYVASKIACDNLSGAIDVMIDNNLVQTNWINANDEAIILTLVEARNLRTAMFSQQSSAYFQELAFKEDINACTTLEELNNININFE